MGLPTRTSAGDLDRPAFTWVDPVMPAAGEDVTALLQATKRALKPGQAIRLPAGTWKLSTNLHTDEASTGLVGAVAPGSHQIGTTLLFTDPNRAGYQVHGQGIGASRGAHEHWLEGVRLEVTGWEKRTSADRTGQNEAGHAPLCLRNGVRGTQVQDVELVGAKAAGLFNYQTSGTRGNRVHVAHTQADGIHSNKWRDAIFTDCSTEDTGDDNIAGVHYNWDKLTEQGRGLKVYRFTGKGNQHGRGLSFINARELDAYDVHVSDTGAAGLIVARETRDLKSGGTTEDGLTDVRVEKMLIERPNFRQYDDHGAVMLVNGNRGEFARVHLSDFDVVDTCLNRPWPTLQSLLRSGPNFAGQAVRLIGYGDPQGAFADVVMDDFRFWGVGPKNLFGGNVKDNAGSLRTRWTENYGKPFPGRSTIPSAPLVETLTVRLRDASGRLSPPVEVPITLGR